MKTAVHKQISNMGKWGLIYGTLTSISAFSEGLKMNKKTQLTQKDPKLMVQVQDLNHNHGTIKEDI